MTYIIHYKNNEPIEKENGEPKENIVDLEYTVYTVEEKDKWFDIIQKSYGNYGEVTVEEIEEEKPLTELEQLKKLVADLTIKDLKSEGAIV